MCSIRDDLIDVHVTLHLTLNADTALRLCFIASLRATGAGTSGE